MMRCVFLREVSKGSFLRFSRRPVENRLPGSREEQFLQPGKGVVAQGFP